jgi:uncharacterized repeat protein (TIGR03803 family)
VIYSFAGGNDGANPQAGLLKVTGVLYGTTASGGANGHGTVFSLTPTPSGTETTLYSFAGYPYDGADPVASLINVNGTLYSTTSEGGGGNCGIRTGCGTVFSITPSGAETVLHSFGQDSAFPEAGLIKVKSTLYGTTASGGANGNGTVFAIPRFGLETTLYSFAGSPYDGANPKAGLVDVNGTLYGTTYKGGANCGSSGGCGTIFAITPSGAETVLHSFAGGGDGSNPPAGLIKVKSTLYGTTVLGGANGYGTVFAIRFGLLTVLHSFAGGSDGANPRAGLIDVNGTLYGTTSGGGANCGSSGGCGTVFSITPSGTETVLHSFGGSPVDGANPYAGLINVKGTLYGTTVFGGANNDGTAFSLTP